MQEKLEEAQGFKLKARNARENEDLEGALKEINSAIGLLLSLWNEYKSIIDQSGADADRVHKELVAQLADAYANKGGILRSQGEYSAAAAEYDKGYEFERHNARQVDNSYNLVQRLVNRILAEPRKTGSASWMSIGKDMWKEIGAAEGVLIRQVSGSRKRDPWAAIDLLTVRVLRGASWDAGDNGLEDAWQRIEKVKPPDFNYKSTLRAARDLLQCLRTVHNGDQTDGFARILAAAEMVMSKLEPLVKPQDR
jgi:tetratricopeptide (TPR) repeat protein